MNLRFREDGAATGPAPRETLKRALRWYLVWDLIALIGVVSGVVLLSWVVARNEALRDAEGIARAVAKALVAPLADDKFHAADPAALARMDQVMELRSRDGSLSHIKVWADAGNGKGTVLWSDQSPLVGQTFELDAEEYAIFGTDKATSQISELDKEENRLERSAGQLIEVYAGTRDATGEPILFEVYISTQRLPDEVRTLIGIILPLPLTAVLVLSLATLPLAVSLAHRVDRGQHQMRALLVNAVESSDLERRRIAQDLHDGVVQDLAGIGYSLDSDMRQLPEGAKLRAHLAQTGEIIRRDLAALRTLVTDIYPPDLVSKGLAETVRELVMQRDVPPGLVRFEIEEPLAPHPVVDRLIYRAIREALWNAVQHAEATSIVVRIAQDDTGLTSFEVVDDGVGFDPTGPSPEGHMGMRLISEMVTKAGGTIDIHSTVGKGTRLTGELPAGAT
ncbi:sensor histidine kinase [Knoellia sp. CPCC 206435]|uniref:sensor histidine kinase n=1 Tax=Knoellia terrae TaxID=3404797 RepID=UPI003B431D11